MAKIEEILTQRESAKKKKASKLFYAPREFKSIKYRNLPDGYRIVILNDIHIPFQDDKVLNSVEKFTSNFKPNLLVLNGDICDFYSASNFSKNPSRLFNLQSELDLAKDWLYSMRAMLPKSDIVLIEGNHEDRLRRWLWNNGSELASLTCLDLAQLLDLQKLNIENACYGSNVDILGFIVEHGHRAAKSAAFPANVARLMAIERGRSGLCGHDHRTQLYSWTDNRGSHSYINNGCLCVKTPEYSNSPNWQHAFSYATVMNGKLYPKLTQIYDSGFWAEGKFYLL